MRIDCPCCGLRDNGEFSYLGDATLLRPTGMDTSLETMTEYVYLRNNVAGRHQELWYHAMGCRAWLVVVRDTKTHLIEKAMLARDVALAERVPA